MASERQLAANRMNAQKSRGPRSVAGKARASRNAIRHGLAVNFWKDPSAAYAIEAMTKLIRESGQSERSARRAAVAEYRMTAVNAARSKIAERLRDAAENHSCGQPFMAELEMLLSIDRYEKQAAYRKKIALRKIQLKVEKVSKYAERTQFFRAETMTMTGRQGSE